MSFILNQKYSDGNTPIRPEEAEQLLPRISTLGELNEYEALNILRAREWAFESRTMKSTDPLDEPYVRALHHRMFDNVWKWAGTYRQAEVPEKISSPKAMRAPAISPPFARLRREGTCTFCVRRSEVLLQMPMCDASLTTSSRWRLVRS